MDLARADPKWPRRIIQLEKATPKCAADMQAPSIRSLQLAAQFSYKTGREWLRRLDAVAGHASLTMSQRYIHPSQDAVLDAIARLGGHKIGHNQKDVPELPVATIDASIVQ